MADGAASAKVAAGAGQKYLQQKWLLAPHQWKLLLMHVLPKSQDPEAVGGPEDKFSLALTDPEAPPMSVGQRTQSNIPTEAERLAQVGATKAACVDAAAAYVDVAGLHA